MGSEGARDRQPWIYRNRCGPRPCCRMGEAGPPLTTALLPIEVAGGAAE
jgi:hypothetical protein